MSCQGIQAPHIIQPYPAIRVIIPPELRDIIIDQLHADTPTLKACSLTCRAWLPRARYHIFYSVTVDPGPSGDAFKQLIETSPEIGKYIQDVELSGVQSKGNWWATGDPQLRISGRWPTLTQPTQERGKASESDEIVSWLKRILPERPQVLKKVDRLTLTSMPVGSAVAEILQPYFATVTRMVWKGCQGLAFNDFVHLKRAFLHIDSLSMIDARWLRTTGIPPGQPNDKKRKQVTTLELSRKIDVVTLCTWLLAQSRYAHMRHISCFLTSHASAIALKELFEAIGTVLEYLGIGFSDVRDPTEVLKSADFNLKPCAGLRRLRITCATTDRLSAYSTSLSWILILLSKVDSPYLRELTFSIHLQDLRALNLDGLVVVLSQCRFKALQMLVFDVEMRTKCEEDEELEQRVRNRLASLDVLLEFYYTVRR